MRSLISGLGIVLAATVAGLAFGAVFPLAALIGPVAAVLVPVLAIDVLAVRFPKLAPARAVLAAVLGALAGLLVLAPPSEAATVVDGALHGWLRTLESTLPARPDAALIAFVPFVTLLAGIVGIEWLRREFPAPATLLPSLALLVIAQVFRATTSAAALVLALAYGAAAALVLGAGRRAPVGRWSGRRMVDAVVVVLPLVLVAGLGAWGLAAVDPLRRPAYTVHDAFEVARLPDGAVSPLNEIGGRLQNPDRAVFTVRTDGPVERWPQLVLDGFDGANWTSSARYRPLGADLDPDPAVAVPRRSFSADIVLADGIDGPWLPSQQRTIAVEGLAPAVDPATGTLISDTVPARGAYTLRWSAPQPRPDELIGATVDRSAAGSVAPPSFPAPIVDAARAALGDVRPTFAAALKLESWMQATFTVATGAELPTGSSTAQLLDFLGRTKRGTSEQFAAAYVLMARSAGIPARLVVGFRQPKADGSGVHVVRNRDAFAWPEVAVAGIGWVPLDPTGGARENPEDAPLTSKATEQARQRAELDAVPAPRQGPPPTPPPPPALDGPSPVTSIAIAVVFAGAALVVLALLTCAAVPVWKWARRRRRRRAPTAQATVNAWLDTRDRLRDHGVRAPASMTVREARQPATVVLGGASAELERIARCVDHALWSGPHPLDPAVADEAWSAATAIRRALAARPLRERARAALRTSRAERR